MSQTPILNWLHNLPSVVGLVVVCAAFVIPTLVGSFLLQPHVVKLLKGERDANTVLGFLMNAFAIYFGVLLALLSIAVFENHNKAEDAVVREAAALIKLYRDLRGYPEPMHDELVGILDKYVEEVIGPGWKFQERDKPNPAEVELVSKFHGVISGFKPSDSGEQTRYAEILRGLDGFVEARRMRISAGGSSIPRIMWIIVLVGAVMNTVLIWMFDMRPFTHAVVGGSLSLFIALVIYMVAVLDAPFRGTFGIKPDPIIAIHEQTLMRR